MLYVYPQVKSRLVLSQLHAQAADDDERYSEQTSGVEALFEKQDRESIHKKRIAAGDCDHVRGAGHAESCEIGPATDGQCDC